MQDSKVQCRQTLCHVPDLLCAQKRHGYEYHYLYVFILRNLNSFLSSWFLLTKYSWQYIAKERENLLCKTTVNFMTQYPEITSGFTMKKLISNQNMKSRNMNRSLEDGSAKDRWFSNGPVTPMIYSNITIAWTIVQTIYCIVIVILDLLEVSMHPLSTIQPIP